MLAFKKCLGLLKRLSDRFMNFTIGTKMVIVYFVVILIPTCLYSLYFYIQISHNITSMYATGNQELMEQSYSSLKSEISQIESIYPLFQYNKSVTEFLSGYYQTEADEIYVYLKDIQPLFAYGHASNSNIENITIYKYQDSLTTLQQYIVGADRFTGNTETINAIPPGKGLWVFDGEHENSLLKYYEKCYSKNYYRELGFIEISVKSSALLDIFKSGKNQALLFQHDDQWFSFENGNLKKISADDATNPLMISFFKSGLSNLKNGDYPVNKKVLVNSLQISELGVKAVLLTPTTNVISSGKEYTPLVYLAVLLVILSLIYYIIISSITRRMVGLARHIRKTDHDHLHEYSDVDYYNDEIGALIKSYNEMITRIGSLVDSLNIAELKKREADFHALQAQIKPHFVYNALETIRMMAESNDDPSVADITYNLGRFMRYNLSRNKDETLLKDEIENVNNYLQIYKVSMGERLIFSINVNCDIKDLKCPAFILQPLVENSLHHGLTSNRGRCIIEVNVFDEEGSIVILIYDNGTGIPKDRLKTIKGVLEGSIDPSELKPKGNGIGIVNVNERIKSYYGSRSGLIIDSGNDAGTTCRIEFERGGRALTNASDDS